MHDAAAAAAAAARDAYGGGGGGQTQITENEHPNLSIINQKQNQKLATI